MISAPGHLIMWIDSAFKGAQLRIPRAAEHLELLFASPLLGMSQAVLRLRVHRSANADQDAGHALKYAALEHCAGFFRACVLFPANSQCNLV